MKEFKLEVPRIRKLLIGLMILCYWAGFIYLACVHEEKVFYFFPVLILFSWLFWFLVSDQTVVISEKSIFIKKNGRKKEVSLANLLDMRFRHSRDPETGLNWGFSFNTVSLDFSFGSPVPLHKCLEVANAVIQAFEPYQKQTWSGVVTAKNDILSFEDNILKINDVLAKEVDYRCGSSIDPTILIDENGKEYDLDLKPLLGDYYIFKSFFKKCVALKFSFAERL